MKEYSDYLMRYIPECYFFGYEGTFIYSLKVEYNEMVHSTRLEF